MRNPRTAAIAGAIGLALASGPCWAQETTGLADVNGGKIEYVVSGPEDGEPVLLIHGGGLADSFALVAAQPALAEYRLIRIFRRGYAGSSEIDSDAFAMEDQAADALALLDALGIETAHVAGHSLGGAVALEMGRQAPGAVRSFVIIETGAPRVAQAAIADGADPGAGPPPLAVAAQPYFEGDAEGALANLFGGIFGEDWRAFFDAVPGGYRQTLDDAPTLFEFDAPALFAWDYGLEDARAISQPVLYLLGADNPAFQTPPAAGFAGPVPDLELVEIPETDHALVVQKPDAVAEAMAAFLAEHPM